MRVKTVQIVWHGGEQAANQGRKKQEDGIKLEPVYSLDFHPSGALATAGADKEVKLWKVERGLDGYAQVEYTGSIVGHQKTVNCVRFSPTGEWLVSSGDDGEMIVWRPAAAGEAPRVEFGAAEGTVYAPWRRAMALSGHSGDITDVSWSCDGTALVSGSIDNKSLIWDMSDKKRGRLLHQLKPHRHYTQGVAWDPAQQFIVTQSADRTCMVHALRPPAAGTAKKGAARAPQQLLPACETAKEFHALKCLNKRAMTTPAGGAGEAEKHSLFQDEAVPTFFRRLAWSPDGSFLAIPTGQYKASPDGRMVNTVYIYARNKWGSPALHLPGHPKPVVAVRFCPVIFRRDDQPQAQQAQQQAGSAEPQATPAPAAGAGAAVGDAAVEVEPGEAAAVPAAPAAAPSEPALPFDLPYKMVFAVATVDSVVLYSTDSLLPLAVVGQLHYDSITDLAWSSDGTYLAVSSRDCYCSVAVFDEGELGTPLKPEELPPHVAARMAAAQRVAAPVAAQAAATPAAAPIPSQHKGAATPAPAKPAATPLQMPALTPFAAARGSPGASQPAAQQAAVQPRQAEEGAAAAAAPQLEQAGSTPAAAGAGGAQQAPKERKRIQPEPVGPTATGGAAQQARQPEVKRKRITPEAVGPAPAVVGDSQGGTQVFGAAHHAVADQQQQEQPAAKKPKRIVPEQIGAPAAGPAGEGISHDPSAAGSQQVAAQAPAAAATKPPKRITPILVAPAAGAAAPSAGAGGGRLVPTESGSMVGAASKQAKRITPTPIKPPSEDGSGQFEQPKQVSYAPPASELSRDGCGGSGNVRRITPVPLSATSPLPEVADSRPPAGGKPGGAAGGPTTFNIAALAMAAGQQAAKQQGKGDAGEN